MKSFLHLALCEVNPIRGGFHLKRTSKSELVDSMNKLSNGQFDCDLGRLDTKLTSHYWPSVGEVHRWPLDSPHKGPVMRSLMMFLLCDTYCVSTSRRHYAEGSDKSWVNDTGDRPCPETYWAVWFEEDRVIKNNAWVTVNNDFWVTSEAICQWFSRVTKSGVKIIGKLPHEWPKNRYSR